MQRTSLVVIVIAVLAALASNASASQLVDRNATAVKLEVNSKGEALLTYKAHGTQKHVLAACPQLTATMKLSARRAA